jgi:hypothetical protein
MMWQAAGMFAGTKEMFSVTPRRADFCGHATTAFRAAEVGTTGGRRRHRVYQF